MGFPDCTLHIATWKLYTVIWINHRWTTVTESVAQLNRYRCILIISWKKPLRRNWFVDAFYQLICISNSYLSNSLFRHHDHMFTGILFTQIILYQGIWLAKKLFWLSCTSSYSYMIKIAHYSLGERCSWYSVIIVINHKFFRLFYVHI